MRDMYTDDELLPLSGVQHYAFCPRQWALIQVEQQWEENARTISGEEMHERCHDQSLRERRGNLLVVRGLRVVSHELGLYGMLSSFASHLGEFRFQERADSGLLCLLNIKMAQPKSGTRIAYSCVRKPTHSKRCSVASCPRGTCSMERRVHVSVSL